MKSFRLFGDFLKERNYERIAVGIITYPYTFLVINKNYKAVYFPGGTLEEGEGEIDALKRELREELNLEIEKISKDCIETYVYSPKKRTNLLVKSYVGTVRGELSINGEEIEGIVVYPFDLIDKDFLSWMNERYLLGPSVIDAFLTKRDILKQILEQVV
ncbi:MAG: hypothetical protein BXU00_01315 [Candidatus Nanoclepta minutus]|uniref:Nudix hydrolase domain-containing protein n=1 Tax=Candidatus Nanoclepta minutus TaxID=1940235 RepID=A0A397WP86_9ARCH|nr:MAG: hypothetical protein BXU00_01315 [Candidatus Nanoclepta minutus]